MSATSSPLPILERVQMILRRDLKLGPDTPIPPDMPFFGGDVDLDSLDILLLVTSIEKEFGVKIPSSDVGQEVFKNVTTLAKYVEQNLNHANAAGTVQASQAPSGTPDYLSRLPHRDPFRFVSRVVRVEEGKSAEGVWSVSGDEAFFAGHFPGNPLVPGVLLGEAMAQIGGIAGATGDVRDTGGMLAHMDIRFDKPIAPPADIILRAKLIRTIASLQQFDVSASVNGVVVASGSLALHRPGGSTGSGGGES